MALKQSNAECNVKRRDRVTQHGERSGGTFTLGTETGSEAYRSCTLGPSNKTQECFALQAKEMRKEVVTY